MGHYFLDRQYNWILHTIEYEFYNVLYVQQAPCVQDVLTPFYLVSYYIKRGNYFLDTQYILLVKA